MLVHAMNLLSTQGDEKHMIEDFVGGWARLDVTLQLAVAGGALKPWRPERRRGGGGRRHHHHHHHHHHHLLLLPARLVPSEKRCSKKSRRRHHRRRRHIHNYC